MYKDKLKQKQAKQGRLDFYNSLPQPKIRPIMTEDEYRASMQPEVKPKESALPYVYKPKPGCVYIIHCVGFPYYKIGVTILNPKARVEALQTGVPFELKVEYALQVTDRYEVEYKIHKRYDSKRVRGEWFMLNDDDLEAIKSEIVLLRDYTWRPPTTHEDSLRAIEKAEAIVIPPTQEVITIGAIDQQ